MSHKKILFVPNKISYNLGLLFVMINAIHCILCLNRMTMDYRIGIFIFLNIAISLVGFLASSELKIYSLAWSRVSLFLAIFEVLRFFIEPQLMYESSSLKIRILLLLAALPLLIASLLSIHLSKARITFKHSESA